MFVVGITGGIGSGKSLVTNLFSDLGVPNIDLDVIARQIVEPGLPAHRQIVAAFGEQFVEQGGCLNRKMLRQHVFANPDQKSRLENILHPQIYREMKLRLLELEAVYSIVVIPLLAESSREYPLDRVLVVDAPRELQISRVVDRDSQSVVDVERIIDAQADRTIRLAIADDVIENSGNVAELTIRVQELHNQYLQLAQTKQ